MSERRRASGWVAAGWTAAVLFVYFTWWDARTAPLRAQAAPLLALAGVLWTAWALGRAAARPRSFLDALDEPLRGPVRLLFGFGLASWLWLLLALAGLLQRPVALLALGGGAALAAFLALRDRPVMRPRLVLPERGRVAALAAAAGALIAAPLLLSPPASTDELVYQLAVPERWVEAGRLTLPPEHFAHAAFPLQLNLLYAWMLLLGLPAAAKLVHAALSITGVVLAARAAGLAGGVAGAWGAAAFVLTLPVALTNFSWAVVDGALAAFVLAGSLLLDGAAAGRRPRAAAAAGLLWGFALAAKLTAALYLAVALLALVLLRREAGGLRRRLGLAVAAGLPAALVALPWWIRSALVHGDPWHPFGARLLGIDNGVRLAEMTGESRGFAGRLQGLITDSITGGPVDESLGVLPILLVPLLLLFRSRLSPLGRRLLAAGLAAWLVLSLGFDASSRFLLPALLLLAVPAGELLGAWWREGGRAAAGATALIVATAVPNLALVAWQSRALFDPLRVSLGVEPEERWLARTERGHATLAAANARLPADARVLALWSTRLFRLERETIVSGPADRPWILGPLREAGDLDGLVARLRAEGVTHLLFDEQEYERRVLRGPQLELFGPGERSLLWHLLQERARLLTVDGRVALYELPAPAGARAP